MSAGLAAAVGLASALLFYDLTFRFPPRPGIWFAATALTCVGGLFVLARLSGVHPTRLDRVLAAATLAIAALVAIWTDPLLYLVNGAATIVGMGLLAAAFGGKLTPRAAASDLLGHAGRAWRNALPRLGVARLLARRAYARLAAGIAVAVMTCVGFYWLLVAARALSDTAAFSVVAGAVGFAVARCVFGWIEVALGRVPTKAAAGATAEGDLAGAEAATGASRSWLGRRRGAIALTVESMLLITVASVLLFRSGADGPVAAVVEVRLTLLFVTAFAACAWRIVTLTQPRLSHAAGAGLIAVTFLAAANVVHPDARVPSLVQDAMLENGAYHDLGGLSDDSVPWMAALAATDPTASTGRVHVALRRDLESRHIQSRAPDTARRWYEWNLAARRAGRLLIQVNGDSVKPVAISVDSDGDVFVADALNARVLRLSADGSPKLLTTIGSRTGQAPQLTGITVAPDGTVYVADQASSSIHRIAPSGAETEAMPVDAEELSAIAADPDGSVWVADTAGDRVLKIGPDGQVARTLGASVDASARPYYRALAAEPGEHGGYQVVVCDTADTDKPAELVRFSLDGQELGRSPIDQPPYQLDRCRVIWDLAVAPEGDAVLTLEYGSRHVQRFTLDGRPLGAWPVDQAIVEFPVAMAAGPGGTAYIVDAASGRIVRFDVAGRPTGVLSGGEGGWLAPNEAESAAGAVKRWQPSDLAVRADGALVIVDQIEERVLALEPDGEQIDAWPARDSGTRRYLGRFDGRVDIGPGGEFLLLDRFHNEVRRYTPDGRLMSSQGQRGAHDGDFDGAASIAAGGDGGFAVLEGERVQWFDADGAYRSQVGAHHLADGHIGRPKDIAVGSDGTVFVLEDRGTRIEAFAPTGDFRTSWGHNWAERKMADWPGSAVAVAPDGRLLTTTIGGRTNWRTALAAIDPDTGLHSVIATFPAYAMRFYDADIAAAPDGAVYIADPTNYTVWRVAPASREAVRLLP